MVVRYVAPYQFHKRLRVKTILAQAGLNEAKLSMSEAAKSREVPTVGGSGRPRMIREVLARMKKQGYFPDDLTRKLCDD